MTETKVGYFSKGDLTRTDREWINVVLIAWTLMQDRQKKRPDVWRRSGTKGMAFELHAKSERLFTNIMSGEIDIDEASAELLDIINYAIFAHIQVVAEIHNGDWPWPT